MATVYQQTGGASWSALWKVDGRQVRKSTFIPVRQAGKKEAQTKKEAQAVAAVYEGVHKGRISLSAGGDALRAVARGDHDDQRALGKRLDVLRALASIGGAASKMPTVREYCAAFKSGGGVGHAKRVKSALARFCAVLGPAADMRLDRLTREHCQNFLDRVGESVRGRTAVTFKAIISGALNRAVDDELLSRNPMTRAKVRADDGADPIRRDALTAGDIAAVLQRARAEYRDLVLICLGSGGQRLGDCACLRWSAVDFARGVLCLVTDKTGQKIENPLLEPLRGRLAALWEEREAGEEYVLPRLARKYMGSSSRLSQDFIRELQACGVASEYTGGEALGGRRLRVHSKSFHGLRRGVVSLLRDGGASADLSRAIVGHSSEEVERMYYRASMEKKAGALGGVFAAVGISPCGGASAELLPRDSGGGGNAAAGE